MAFGVGGSVFEFGVWGFVLLISDQDLNVEELIGVRHFCFFATLDRPKRNLITGFRVEGPGFEVQGSVTQNTETCLVCRV